jgi:hypothetical protein
MGHAWMGEIDDKYDTLQPEPVAVGQITHPMTKAAGWVGQVPDLPTASP